MRSVGTCPEPLGIPLHFWHAGSIFWHATTRRREPLHLFAHRKLHTETGPTGSLTSQEVCRDLSLCPARALGNSLQMENTVNTLRASALALAIGVSGALYYHYYGEDYAVYSCSDPSTARMLKHAIENGPLTKILNVRVLHVSNNRESDLTM